MAGPWEAFQDQPAATGPWSDFQQPNAAQPPSLGHEAAAVGVAPLRGTIAGLGSPGDLQSFIERHNPFDYLANKYSEAYPEQSAKNVALAGKVGRVSDFGETRLPTSGDVQKVAENIVGPLPEEAQSKVGQYLEAPARAAGNPLSYLGPGSALLKLIASITSGVGGQAGKDIGGTLGEVIGSLAGGTAAAKTLGPKAVEAAIPKAAELKQAAKTGGQFGGYEGALNSGLELDPSKVAVLGAAIEQRLNAKGFTGGSNGTAKGTIGDIQGLQSPPAGSSITAANLDTIRATLQRRAQETVTDARGVTRSTSDAVAAQRALDDFKAYTQNIPQSHVLAGDAAAYRNATTEANANYAASMRTKSAEQRIDTANFRYERKPNVTYGSQLKGQFGPMLEKDYRTKGFTPEEVQKLRDINTAGGKAVDLLGSRSLPALAVHALFGIPSMGMSLPVSVAANYGARKLGSALTGNQANQFAQMLAKRSPLYQQRLNALPPSPQGMSPQTAQLIRSGLLGLQ